MLLLIVNPSAGGGRAGRSLSAVRAALGSHGLGHAVAVTRDLNHARELAAAALASGQTPVAYGGDGLVAAVADAVRISGSVMGVLPGGRGNDFARCLGLPLDPVTATEVLAAGAPMAVDMGAVGDRTFLGIATCGLDSEANRIANSARVVRDARSTPTVVCAPWPAGARSHSGCAWTVSGMPSAATRWQSPTRRCMEAACFSHRMPP